ncbi:uncharacterized protein LOC124657650 [Lolium rigidum]|uniref:uncharacterized protein LOC124657650 n=1 Tax=Lolium rigidum TaxID=89674 RepID=UPI001F5E34BF|nr:uncharacterized protein LOC124657650 [Lolium rigidum]
MRACTILLPSPQRPPPYPDGRIPTSLSHDEEVAGEITALDPGGDVSGATTACGGVRQRHLSVSLPRSYLRLILVDLAHSGNEPACCRMICRFLVKYPFDFFLPRNETRGKGTLYIKNHFRRYMLEKRQSYSKLYYAQYLYSEGRIRTSKVLFSLLDYMFCYKTIRCYLLFYVMGRGWFRMVENVYGAFQTPLVMLLWCMSR